MYPRTLHRPTWLLVRCSPFGHIGSTKRSGLLSSQIQTARGSIDRPRLAIASNRTSLYYHNTVKNLCTDKVPYLPCHCLRVPRSTDCRSIGLRRYVQGSSPAPLVPLVRGDTGLREGSLGAVRRRYLLGTGSLPVCQSRERELGPSLGQKPLRKAADEQLARSVLHFPLAATSLHRSVSTACLINTVQYAVHGTPGRGRAASCCFRSTAESSKADPATRESTRV